MKKFNMKSIGITLVLSFVFSFISAQTVLAAGPATVNLGASGNFTILSKTGISTTGSTAVVGDLGVSPAAASYVTGFSLILPVSGAFSSSALVTGKVYASDYSDPTPNNLTTAISDMQTAYTDAVGRPANSTELGAGNIGGLTLAPGTYKWGTSVIIPTDVTLSGGANDIWIFQIAQNLIVSSGTKIILAGGAQASNIFWVVAGQTTLGTGAQVNGNILDQTAIVFNTGATLTGRALAQTAVTLDANTVTSPTAPSPLPVSTPVPPVKNPITYKVTTNKKTYTQDEDIAITISAMNSNAEPQTLSFTSGCQVSYLVASYDSSKNQVCTMEVTSVVIGSNASKDWVLTHRPGNFKIPVGEYTLLGKVTNHGEATTSIAVTAPVLTPISISNQPAIVTPLSPVVMPGIVPVGTVVSGSQPSQKPISCPAGKKLLCSPGMLREDGTSTTVCTCVVDTTTPRTSSAFGQQVKMIAQNLGKGGRGSDVAVLQQFLISQNKGSASKALAQVGVTSYFGVLTKAALAEFQANVGISPSLGNFGPITRAHMSRQN